MGGDDVAGSDDNGPEALAVRRAFMTSICSSHRNTSADIEPWTYEEILAWIESAIKHVRLAELPSLGVKAFWKEWETIEQRVPASIRTNIVKGIDAQLSSLGYPSLREMVAE